MVRPDVLSATLATLLAAGAAQALEAKPAPTGSPPAISPALTEPPRPSVAPPAPLVTAPLATPAAKPRPVMAATPTPEPVRLSDDPRPTLGPGTFVATVAAAERYRAIAEGGGWSTVPNEATRLKPGDRGPIVGLLRRRLAATGDLAAEASDPALFDEALAAAVRRMQGRHGLEPTGLVGPRTLAALNVSVETRVRQLENSAGRLLGSKFPFGDRYVAVNIPSAAVEAVDHGIVARRYVAVVGKPDRASPQVETRVTSVNLNPTWTVPVSLIRKDIIPHVRKDPTYLARLKIRLFDAAGQEVDPGTIDWSTERAASYTVRQDSGAENSLGEVRLDMPNRFSVYMHDTPSKRLFARERRTHSSGCVRVAGVKDLAAWLLESTPGPSGPGSVWGPIEIETAIAAGRRVDVRLSRPVPVAWVYLTGYAGPDGTVQFRDDVYGLDEPPAEGPAPGQLTLDALVTSSITPARPAAPSR